jgi:hypothetical protein
MRKPERKTTDVVVAQKRPGKGTAKHSCAKRKINDLAIASLKQELKTGKGFNSYGAIVEWLKNLKKLLKNELFSSLQALRDRLEQLFEQLTFEQVMSISSYNFILEALFYVAS